MGPKPLAPEGKAAVGEVAMTSIPAVMSAKVKVSLAPKMAGTAIVIFHPIILLRWIIRSAARGPARNRLLCL